MRKFIFGLIIGLLVAIPTGAFAAGYITSADIKDKTITNLDIADHTIGYKKLRSSSVNTYKIANYSIKGIDIEDRTIPLKKLAAGVARKSHDHDEYALQSDLLYMATISDYNDELLYVYYNDLWDWVFEIWWELYWDGYISAGVTSLNASTPNYESLTVEQREEIPQKLKEIRQAMDVLENK